MKEKDLELIKNFDQLPSAMQCSKNVVLRITGWSRSTLHRRIKSGHFPLGEKILGNKVPTWSVKIIREAFNDTVTQPETSFAGSSCNLKILHNQNTSETEKTLIYPAKFDHQEIDICDSLLISFDQQLAQQLLDEVQGNIELKTIRRSPISLLSSLCQRAKSGDFTPALGLTIKKKRDEVNNYLKPRPPSQKTSMDPAVIKQRLKNVRLSLAKNKAK